MRTSDTTSQRPIRCRSRERTKAELQLAILRVKNKNIKMSIAAVAAEAGVSPSLVHNTYPDIAEEIRAQVGRSVRQQRDEKATELTNARATLRALREELRAARRDIAKLASVNETLNDEVAVLRAEVDGKVRTLPRREDR